MKTLRIKWQRLMSKGDTCARCGSTEKEIDKAVLLLRKSLEPKGIEVKVEKARLSIAEFKKNPSRSNRIWINSHPLEDWINGRVGHSTCCDVCGPSECRTLEVDDRVYEAIPSDILVKAGLLAAAEITKKKTKS